MPHSDNDSVDSYLSDGDEQSPQVEENRKRKANESPKLSASEKSSSDDDDDETSFKNQTTSASLRPEACKQKASRSSKSSSDSGDSSRKRIVSSTSSSSKARNKATKKPHAEAIQRQPGETEAEFQKRRQRIYDARSYERKKERMAEKKRKQRTEVRKPSTLAAIPANDKNKVKSALDKFIGRFIEIPIESWAEYYAEKKKTRVIQVSRWLDPESSGSMVPLPLKGSTVIYHKNEIDRHFIIQFYDGDSWCDLLEIKKSSLTDKLGLRDDVGFGLFAARPFPAGEVIGVYLGKVFRSSSYRWSSKGPYTLVCDSELPHSAKKRSNDMCQYVVDPGKRSHDQTNGQPPTYFGIHFAIDPRSYIAQSPPGTLLPELNIAILQNLKVVTLKDINLGEELFLEYELEEAK